MTLSRIVLASVLALAAVAAQAHALLDRADPRVGSTVAAPPAELRLWFAEDVEGAFTTAHVADAQGHRVDTASAQVDAHDHKLLHVPLARLAPGTYTVTWRVVSIDTHVTEGRFVFRVAP